ncbi:MAG: preprotein translocase subunit SecE [Nitrospirae bacterium]|nr:preprotein translocase subunit SecE [Nitrospirota bacterium]
MLQRIKDFFKEVKIELKKVVFPKRDEVIGSTWVVIITVLIISAFLGLIDIWLSRLVSVALK